MGTRLYLSRGKINPKYNKDNIEDKYIAWDELYIGKAYESLDILFKGRLRDLIYHNYNRDEDERGIMRSDIKEYCGALLDIQDVSSFVHNNWSDEIQNAYYGDWQPHELIETIQKMQAFIQSIYDRDQILISELY